MHRQCQRGPTSKRKWCVTDSRMCRRQKEIEEACPCSLIQVKTDQSKKKDYLCVHVVSWYDNPQPALRPVFIVSQCATQCVKSVCMYGWCAATVVATVHMCVCESLCAVYIYSAPSLPLDNIRVMVIVWRLRGNIIRTALCCIVWHSVHSPQHTYVSSSYRSNRLGLSHWDPYAVHRGSCLELCYCNMVEWFWWDSSLNFDDQLVSFGALTLLVWSSGL